MATVQKFEELEVWQLARILAGDVYKLTQHAGFSKQLYLRDQMNRSAGSVMDNIAEGYGRGSRLEFVQFLSIAAGSVEELNHSSTAVSIFNLLNRKNLRKYTAEPV